MTPGPAEVAEAAEVAAAWRWDAGAAEVEIEALSGGHTLPGIETVVHLAAIPSPAHATPDQVFRTNITSTYTVFSAAARLGLPRVVWASSETTLGLPFERPPDYAPVDEALVT